MYEFSDMECPSCQHTGLVKQFSHLVPCDETVERVVEGFWRYKTITEQITLR